MLDSIKQRLVSSNPHIYCHLKMWFRSNAIAFFKNQGGSHYCLEAFSKTLTVFLCCVLFGPLE